MNLAPFLLQRWAASAELNALLPVEKVFTGMSCNSARPYAIIAKESVRPISRQNDGSAIDRIVMRIQIFHNHYDAAAAAMTAVEATYEGAVHENEDGRKVLAMRRVAETEKQLDSQTWQFTVDFECTVYLPEGI